MLSNYYSRKNEYTKISRGRKDGLLELLGDYENTSILDIGCGEGVLGSWLKQGKKVEVNGIDISTTAIQKAQEVLDDAYVGDIEDGEWPKEIVVKKFDTIILSEVLEHLFSPEEILMRLRDMTTPQTDIILTVPNVLFWKNRLRLFIGHFEYEASGLMDRGHIHFFSWKSFREMISGCGYHIAETAHHSPTRAFRPLKNVLPGLFAHNFIVKIKKI